MCSNPPDYRLYPSLLDQFERYIRSEEAFEDISNSDGEGGYKLSFEEIERQRFESLIDSINRVPFKSEAADKGTAFNALVDSFIHKERNPDVKMRGDRNADTITAEYDGNTFVFSFSFVEQAAAYFAGATSQLFVSAPLRTRYGTVELYGYIDEILRDKVFDIKTTSRYEFGKYRNGWQKHVYPYCLEKSGLVEDIDSFEYTAYLLRTSGGVITGTQYPELYKHDARETEAMLMEHCERFIEFLEDYRCLITDRKIFGGENN